MGDFRRTVFACLALSVLVLILICVLLTRKIHRGSLSPLERDIIEQRGTPPVDHVVHIAPQWQKGSLKDDIVGPAVEYQEELVGQYFDVGILHNDNVISRGMMRHAQTHHGYRDNLATLLSHRETMARIVNECWSHTLVIYGDVRLMEDFSVHVHELLELLEPDTRWDVLVLDAEGYQGEQWILEGRVFESMSGRDSNVYIVRNSESAQKLHSRWPISETVFDDSVKVYCAVPALTRGNEE